MLTCFPSARDGTGFPIGICLPRRRDPLLLRVTEGGSVSRWVKLPGRISR